MTNGTDDSYAVLDNQQEDTPYNRELLRVTSYPVVLSDDEGTDDEYASQVSFSPAQPSPDITKQHLGAGYEATNLSRLYGATPQSKDLTNPVRRSGSPAYGSPAGGGLSPFAQPFKPRSAMQEAVATAAETPAFAEASGAQKAPVTSAFTPIPNPAASVAKSPLARASFNDESAADAPLDQAKVPGLPAQQGASERGLPSASHPSSQPPADLPATGAANTPMPKAAEPSPRPSSGPSESAELTAHPAIQQAAGAVKGAAASLGLAAGTVNPVVDAGAAKLEALVESVLPSQAATAQPTSSEQAGVTGTLQHAAATAKSAASTVGQTATAGLETGVQSIKGVLGGETAAEEKLPVSEPAAGGTGALQQAAATAKSAASTAGQTAIAGLETGVQSIKEVLGVKTPAEEKLPVSEPAAGVTDALQQAAVAAKSTASTVGQTAGAGLETGVQSIKGVLGGKTPAEEKLPVSEPAAGVTGALQQAAATAKSAASAVGQTASAGLETGVETVKGVLVGKPPAEEKLPVSVSEPAEPAVVKETASVSETVQQQAPKASPAKASMASRARAAMQSAAGALGFSSNGTKAASAASSERASASEAQTASAEPVVPDARGEGAAEPAGVPAEEGAGSAASGATAAGDKTAISQEAPALETASGKPSELPVSSSATAPGSTTTVLDIHFPAAANPHASGLADMTAVVAGSPGRAPTTSDSFKNRIKAAAPQSRAPIPAEFTAQLQPSPEPRAADEAAGGPAAAEVISPRMQVLLGLEGSAQDSEVARTSELISTAAGELDLKAGAGAEGAKGAVSDESAQAAEREAGTSLVERATDAAQTAVGALAGAVLPAVDAGVSKVKGFIGSGTESAAARALAPEAQAAGVEGGKAEAALPQPAQLTDRVTSGLRAAQDAASGAVQSAADAAQPTLDAAASKLSSLTGNGTATGQLPADGSTNERSIGTAAAPAAQPTTGSAAQAAAGLTSAADGAKAAVASAAESAASAADTGAAKVAAFFGAAPELAAKEELSVVPPGKESEVARSGEGGIQGTVAGAAQAANTAVQSGAAKLAGFFDTNAGKEGLPQQAGEASSAEGGIQTTIATAAQNATAAVQSGAATAAQNATAAAQSGAAKLAGFVDAGKANAGLPDQEGEAKSAADGIQATIATAAQNASTAAQTGVAKLGGMFGATAASSLPGGQKAAPGVPATIQAASNQVAPDQAPTRHAEQAAEAVGDALGKLGIPGSAANSAAQGVQTAVMAAESAAITVTSRLTQAGSALAHVSEEVVAKTGPGHGGDMGFPSQVAGDAEGGKGVSEATGEGLERPAEAIEGSASPAAKPSPSEIAAPMAPAAASSGHATASPPTASTINAPSSSSTVASGGASAPLVTTASPATASPSPPAVASGGEAAPPVAAASPSKAGPSPSVVASGGGAIPPVATTTTREASSTPTPNAIPASSRGTLPLPSVAPASDASAAKLAAILNRTSAGTPPVTPKRGEGGVVSVMEALLSGAVPAEGPEPSAGASTEGGGAAVKEEDQKAAPVSLASAASLLDEGAAQAKAQAAARGMDMAVVAAQIDAVTEKAKKAVAEAKAAVAGLDVRTISGRLLDDALAGLGGPVPSPGKGKAVSTAVPAAAERGGVPPVAPPKASPTGDKENARSGNSPVDSPPPSKPADKMQALPAAGLVASSPRAAASPAKSQLGAAGSPHPSEAAAESGGLRERPPTQVAAMMEIPTLPLPGPGAAAKAGEAEGFFDWDEPVRPPTSRTALPSPKPAGGEAGTGNGLPGSARGSVALSQTPARAAAEAGRDPEDTPRSDIIMESPSMHSPDGVTVSPPATLGSRAATLGSPAEVESLDSPAPSRAATPASTASRRLASPLKTESPTRGLNFGLAESRSPAALRDSRDESLGDDDGDSIGFEGPELEVVGQRIQLPTSRMREVGPAELDEELDAEGSDAPVSSRFLPNGKLPISEDELVEAAFANLDSPRAGGSGQTGFAGPATAGIPTRGEDLAQQDAGLRSSVQQALSSFPLLGRISPTDSIAGGSGSPPSFYRPAATSAANPTPGSAANAPGGALASFPLLGGISPTDSPVSASPLHPSRATPSAGGSSGLGSQVAAMEDVSDGRGPPDRLMSFPLLGRISPTDSIAGGGSPGPGTPAHAAPAIFQPSRLQAGGAFDSPPKSARDTIASFQLDETVSPFAAMSGGVPTPLSSSAAAPITVGAVQTSPMSEVSAAFEETGKEGAPSAAMRGAAEKQGLPPLAPGKSGGAAPYAAGVSHPAEGQRIGHGLLSTLSFGSTFSIPITERTESEAYETASEGLSRVGSLAYDGLGASGSLGHSLSLPPIESPPASPLAQVASPGAAGAVATAGTNPESGAGMGGVPSPGKSVSGDSPAGLGAATATVAGSPSQQEVPTGSTAAVGGATGAGAAAKLSAGSPAEGRLGMSPDLEAYSAVPKQAEQEVLQVSQMAPPGQKLGATAASPAGKLPAGIPSPVPTPAASPKASPSGVPPGGSPAARPGAPQPSQRTSLSSPRREPGAAPLEIAPATSVGTGGLAQTAPAAEALPAPAKSGQGVSLPEVKQKKRSFFACCFGG